jgi:hypothetical protein
VELLQAPGQASDSRLSTTSYTFLAATDHQVSFALKKCFLYWVEVSSGDALFDVQVDHKQVR